MVEVERLELPAPWSQTTCATKLRYTSIFVKPALNLLNMYTAES